MLTEIRTVQKVTQYRFWSSVLRRHRALPLVINHLKEACCRHSTVAMEEEQSKKQW
jgi:hypothetical protein